MATKKTVTKQIVVPEISPQIATIKIVGDSDIVINKMNDVTKRLLTGERTGMAAPLEKPNVWEEIITSIHWFNGKPDEFSEETFKEKLDKDSPCFTAFGMKKQMMKAVVRNNIDNYSTKFDANVNVLTKVSNLIPINFSEHYLDEILMQPKKGKPVLQRLNRFSGWSAEMTISYMENVFSLSSIISIINLTGFGIGIGSGTSSGFGRFHVEGVK